MRERRMKERIRPTQSGLFAIELVAAVGVFTLCAAVCLGVFVQSEVMSQDSAALTRAVNEARNAAERFKAAGGSLDRMAALFGGEIQPDGETVSLFQNYDKDWNPVPDGETVPQDGISYQLRLTPDTRSAPDGCAVAQLRAVRNDGQVVLSWEIAALEAVS
ncbi:MAG: hypothetical protein IJK52_06695 [Oscillospiraceae bacterium]|nr:hypothetical protein [Oscillospiraceae bacterium]